MKIGILGGTFDPIHIGHLYIGYAAMLQFGLDRVWFMPAGDPYFKDEMKVTERHLRLEMTGLSVDAFNRDPMLQRNLSPEQSFQCSDFEMPDHEHTYTAETLEKLHDEHPEDQFYFILGMDSLKALPQWHRPEAILEHAVILCAYRRNQEEGRGCPSIYELCDRMRIEKEADPEAVSLFNKAVETIKHSIPGADGRIRLINAPVIQLSSSFIREQVSEGRSVSGLVLKPTEDFILRHRLYKN